MATYKETTNCLLFFSPQDFLASVNKLFEYKFDKVPDQNKYILLYRPVNTTEWKKKPISFCLKNHSIQKENNYYHLVTQEGNTDEDMLVLDIKEYLVKLVADNNNQPRLDDHISKIRLWEPYGWKAEKELEFLKEPGLLTIRLGNGYGVTKDGNTYYGVNLGFNSWRHKTVLSRKRRLPDTNETV